MREQNTFICVQPQKPMAAADYYHPCWLIFIVIWSKKLLASLGI